MSTKQHRRPEQTQLEKPSVICRRASYNIRSVPSDSAKQASEFAVVSEIDSRQPVTDTEITMILSALGDTFINILRPSSTERSACTDEG